MRILKVELDLDLVNFVLFIKNLCYLHYTKFNLLFHYKRGAYENIETTYRLNISY